MVILKSAATVVLSKRTNDGQLTKSRPSEERNLQITHAAKASFDPILLKNSIFLWTGKFADDSAAQIRDRSTNADCFYIS